LRCLLAKNHATFEQNLSEEISRKQQNPILSRGDKTRLELFCSALSDLQTSDPLCFAGLKHLIGQTRKQAEVICFSPSKARCEAVLATAFFNALLDEV
jgi:ABC-type transporter Mla MlaB component